MIKKILKNLLFTTFFLALFVTPVLVLAQASESGCSGLICCENPPDCSFDDLMKTVQNIVEFLLQIGIAFTAIVMAYAGFTYLTAGGDSGKINKAHKMFQNAFIGLLIALGAFLVIQLLVNTLGLKTGIINLQ